MRISSSFTLEDQYNRRSGKRSAFQSLVSALWTIYGMSEESDEIDGTEDAATIYAKFNDKNQNEPSYLRNLKHFMNGDYRTATSCISGETTDY